MGCIHSRFQEGCSYYVEEDEKDDNLGCDESGNCICEEDESPGDMCTYYESDGSDDEEDDVEG